jgi:outer membrane protein assembly factor BamB
MSRRSSLPWLCPPLIARWATETDSTVISRTAATDGYRIVVVASGSDVTGLSLADGSVAWRRTVLPYAAEIQGVDRGVVVASGEVDDTTLSAFSWNGVPLWEHRSGISTGVERLRGAGSQLLVVGVGTAAGDEQVCQVRSAATGDVTLEFPVAGDVPDATAFGFVWSARSDDPAEAGLFLFDPDTANPQRLVDVPHSIREVGDGVAVIDTSSTESGFGRLIAVDLSNGDVLWETDGGGAPVLAIDQGQLACARAVDGERVAVTLRQLRTGEPIWSAAPATAEAVSLLLAGDCVVSSVPAERIDLYDRANGHQLQSLAEATSLVKGGCVTGAGLVDATFAEVRCYSRTRP